MILVPPIQEISSRNAVSLTARWFFPNHQEPVRITIRQRFEQHRIDYTEDGGVGPYPQCDRHHGHDGETTSLGESAKAVSDVSEEHPREGLLALFQCHRVVAVYVDATVDAGHLNGRATFSETGVEVLANREMRFRLKPEIAAYAAIQRAG